MTEDKYIWAEFKNDTGNALSYIYNQNVDFLFCYGKKFTPDEDFILDIIHDLFYDLIKYRKNLIETDNIRLYLLKSFRRKLIRGIESKKQLDAINNTYSLVPNIIFSIEEEMIINEELLRKTKLIRKALHELNSKQREVLYYKFTLGYDYSQICEIMSISYDSARQMVSRAINTLKQYVSENDLFLLFFCRKIPGLKK